MYDRSMMILHVPGPLYDDPQGGGDTQGGGGAKAPGTRSLESGKPNEPAPPEPGPTRGL
jgi:hypothetical protein